MSTFAKITRKWARFFIVFGLIFGIVPWLFMHQEFTTRLEGELVNAEVINVQEHINHDDDGTYYTYTPTFRFEYDGVTIEKKTNGSSSAYYYPIGTKKQIYYSPETGYIFANESSDYLILLFPGIGLIAVICWIAGIVNKRKRKQKIANLKEMGVRKQGKFAGIKDTGMRVNSVSQVCVMVSDLKSWPITDEAAQKVRYSDIISATQAHKYTADSTFTVYVDPLNPEEYFVDLENNK